MARSVARSLAKAQAIARGRGVALTPIRRDVLELVLKAGRPVGAYALLAELETKNGKAMPPTVYRALDFLMEQGFVHKIESLNAFIGCLDLDHAHRSQFVICNDCGQTVELLDDALSTSLDERAHKLDFEVTQQVVEIRGVCADCRGKAVA
jgi:Fur family transcriptional regulator, zinc uptake regulator